MVEQDVYFSTNLKAQIDYQKSLEKEQITHQNLEFTEKDLSAYYLK